MKNPGKFDNLLDHSAEPLFTFTLPLFNRCVQIQIFRVLSDDGAASGYEFAIHLWRLKQ